MGLAFAKNLIERGHTAIGYRRSAMDEFIAAGGTPATSPRDVAERADVVLVCLPNAAALAEVVSGPDGIAAAARDGLVVFDLNTFPAAEKEPHRQALAAKGMVMMDCTVTGNQTFIARRQSGMFVSGEREAFDRFEGVLRDVTDNVAYVGAFGAGTAVKLIAALLTAVNNLAAAEAFAMATRAGVDRQALYDAIAGTPASSGMFESRGKYMVTRDYGPGGSLGGYLRNLALTVDLADTVGGDYKLLRDTVATLQAATKAGYGELEQSGVLEYLLADGKEAKKAG